MVELHPVTTLLPEMRHDEYQDLVASIRENGLRDAIAPPVPDLLRRAVVTTHRR